MSKYGLDKFYTKDAIVDLILKKIQLNEFNVIIEPSAGAGAFSNKIHNCIAYDIQPENNNIVKQDFLQLNRRFDGKVLIIGNPPFGRNNSLSLAFIKKSAEIADTIAFILPLSYKKQSLYDKIPLSFWKVYEEDLPKNSFIFENKDINIPCVFQIYVKRSEKREKQKPRKPKTFMFTKKSGANVAIRRVGVYAGTAYLDINKSEESHYFVYVDNPNEFINYVNAIKWEHNNTVGPRSISKQELIIKLEK